MTDLLAVLLSFGYVFLILGLAEGLRRAFKLGAEFTRKVVHIGVGLWAFGTAALFTSPSGLDNLTVPGARAGVALVAAGGQVDCSCAGVALRDRARRSASSRSFTFVIY